MKFGAAADAAPLFSTGGAGKTLTPPTFARTGTAYLDGVSYAANVARFPNTAGTVGVLVEEATTNLFLYSHEFDNAYWTKGSCTITANAATAPDDTLTADLLTSTGANGLLSRSVTPVTGSTPYTMSVYMRSDTPITVALLLNDTSGYTQVNVNVTTQWQRFSVTKTTIASPARMDCYIGGANTLVTGATVYVWGAQFEAKGYATQYIPTSGATATRNAETLTIPTAGIMRADRGTVVVRAYAGADIAAASPANTHALFSHRSNAAGNDAFEIYMPAGSKLRARTANSANTATTVTWDTTLSAGWHISGIRWSAADLSLWVDGVGKSGGAPNLPGALASTANVGSFTGGSLQYDYPIAYVAIYDRALSDAEMAAATSGNLPSGYTAMVDFRSGTLKSTASGGKNITYNIEDLFNNLITNNMTL